jgi:ribose 5-phosphate isomerase RpiB
MYIRISLGSDHAGFELKEYIKASLSENTTLTKDTIQKKYK